MNAFSHDQPARWHPSLSIVHILTSRDIYHASDTEVQEVTARISETVNCIAFKTLGIFVLFFLFICFSWSVFGLDNDNAAKKNPNLSVCWESFRCRQRANFFFE
ncbi:uncharacterized protein TrAFT101_007639 [Trichoderma asperellum]|uniref:uncharacterized protein n=1 Tax=Trichoderma asperellum TaxID=101201 RepID=UPI003320FC9C|nr:hypothetical protein TrAFT101_007639 [Trichoderma asperellum]